MKNAMKLLGIIALVAVIGFTMAACGGGDDGNNHIAVTGVTLNKASTTIEVGKTETLTATVAPDDATNPAVTWSSSNTAVATVSGGTVTAVAIGTATITVTTTDDENKNATCAVTVTGSSDPTELRLSDVPVTIIDTPSSFDFGYRTTGDGLKPLSNFITGTPKALIASDKLTLELDKPKDEELGLLSGVAFPPAFTITPSTVKGYLINYFYTSDGGYCLYMKVPGSITVLIYVDNDVTINGTDGDNTADNVSLKKGWNFAFFSDSIPHVLTVSQAQPDGATWTVEED